MELNVDISSLTVDQAKRQLAEVELLDAQLSTLRMNLVLKLLGGAAQPGGQDELLTLDQAAERIGVSKAYFYRNKKLPFLRRINGKRTMVSKQALDRWCESRKPR